MRKHVIARTHFSRRKLIRYQTQYAFASDDNENQFFYWAKQLSTG